MRGKSLRILMVNNRFPPYMTGGYEVSASLMARGLADRGHHVEVLVSRFGMSGRGPRDGVRRSLHRVVDSPSPATLLRLEWVDRLVMERAVRRYRPHLISAWNLEGLFPSVLQAIAGSGQPSVFHVHGVYLDYLAEWAREWRNFWRSPSSGGRLRGRAKATLGRLARMAGLATGWPETVQQFPLANAVFCSDFIRRENESRGVVARRARVILSGVDTDRFNPSGRTHSTTLRLLFAGRLHESKGAHLAVEALEMLLGAGHEATLTLAGAIPPDRLYYDAIMARVSTRALAARVRLRGMVDTAEMPRLFREHDVLLNPTRHLEGLPRSAMESMACGCVVVGYPTGGGAELFQHDRNSIIVESDEPEDLAQAVRLLAADRSRLERLSGDGARFIADRHSVARVVEETEAFYNEVLSTPQ